MRKLVFLLVFCLFVLTGKAFAFPPNGLPFCTAAKLAAGCGGSESGNHAWITDGISSSDCTVGGGGDQHECAKGANGIWAVLVGAGGQNQSPWLGNIDADQFSLLDIRNVTGIGKINLSYTSPAYQAGDWATAKFATNGQALGALAVVSERDVGQFMQTWSFKVGADVDPNREYLMAYMNAAGHLYSRGSWTLSGLTNGGCNGNVTPNNESCLIRNISFNMQDDAYYGSPGTFPSGMMGLWSDADANGVVQQLRSGPQNDAHIAGWDWDGYENWRISSKGDISFRPMAAAPVTRAGFVRMWAKNDGTMNLLKADGTNTTFGAGGSASVTSPPTRPGNPSNLLMWNATDGLIDSELLVSLGYADTAGDSLTFNEAPDDVGAEKVTLYAFEAMGSSPAVQLPRVSGVLPTFTTLASPGDNRIVVTNSTLGGIEQAATGNTLNPSTGALAIAGAATFASSVTATGGVTAASFTASGGGEASGAEVTDVTTPSDVASGKGRFASKAQQPIYVDDDELIYKIAAAFAGGAVANTITGVAVDGSMDTGTEACNASMVGRVCLANTVIEHDDTTGLSDVKACGDDITTGRTFSVGCQ